jgi:purine-binding chemotaxis protein CheW
MDKQLVLFGLGNRNFGVDVESVVRIGQIPEITNKPKSPRYIEGQLNLCGCAMPVVDLHRWFGMFPQERSEESRVMIANINGMKIGMIVSAVTDVISVDENAIELQTKRNDNNKSKFILGVTDVNEQVITLVDLEQILSAEEKDQLKSFQLTSL